MFVGYLQEKQKAMCPHVSVVSDADNDAGYCDADNDDVLFRRMTAMADDCDVRHVASCVTTFWVIGQK